MRVCTKCHISKDESEFFLRNKETRRLHAQCKTCYQSHRVSYYNDHYKKYKKDYLLRAKTRRECLKKEFQLTILEYLKDKSCVDCGESDIRTLEFDHLNPLEKSFTVSQAVRLGRNVDEVLSEIKKCRVLCANCHKKRTAKQFGWYKANL